MPSLPAAVWADFRRTAGPLAAYEVVFKLLAGSVLVPASGWLLAWLVATTGHTAVSNTDILTFLLTPAGVLAAGVVGVAALSASLLEHTGALAVIALTLGGRRVTVGRAVLAVLAGILRVLRLGAVQLGVLALVAAPFVVLAGLTYLAFLSRN